MDKFEKQPYEEFTVSTNFSKNFSSGEVVESQAVTAIDNLGNDVTTMITNQVTVANDGASGVSVLVRSGSEDKSPYKLSFRCVTNRGHRWEHDIQMKVREI